MGSYVYQGSSGLSPRVRGNRVTHRIAGQVLGSIPACAGEPISSVRMVWTTRVYPRVCGGTTLYSLVGFGVRGLSPRVRGNPEARRGSSR